MSSQLTITQALSSSGWTITASIASGGAIPQAIFVYLNTGVATQLGAYQGIVSPTDLARLNIYDGVTTFPIFANKYLRYSTGTILVPIGSSVTTAINTLVAEIQNFSTAFQAQQTITTSYTIS